MNSAHTCTRCLRVLRRVARAEKLKPSLLIKDGVRPARAFSTRPAHLQQAASQERPPPFPPTTAGTVTSNITATPPAASDPPPSSKHEPSTAEMQRQIASRLGSTRPDLGTALAQRFRKTAKKTSDTYITYGLTEALFKHCSAEADYTIPENKRLGILTGDGPAKTAGGEDLGDATAPSWWFDSIGLQPTFSTWSQVTYLHMYLLTVRLRALEDSSSFQNYQRYLLEHFSHAAEDKMLVLHGMPARGIRNRYLKDLFLQWRGLLAAYDEGLVKGDAVLAGAVWRNLFKGDEDVDWTKVAEVVVYMRRVTGMLGETDLGDVNDALTAERGLFQDAREGVRALVEFESSSSAVKEALVDQV